MKISAGDTAWVLASTALVLLMTPGLALFYGGMVRAKNVLGMLMQNFATIGVVSLVWVWVTYSLAFAPDTNGFIGNFNFFGLANTNNATGSIPTLVFVAFQLMFAVITPALITGASADRLKFGSFIVFIIAWSVLVYAPVAHWVWAAGGWLNSRGAEDFAGGTVVHINAGVAGLAVAMVIGRRKGWPKRAMPPHNLPMTLLGAGLLWFGWFGFNAGSALAANNLAANAFINTNTATAAALLGWILVEKLANGKCTTLGAASGAVAGLVAITPACGFVNILGSTVIGVVAGVACALAVRIKYKIKLDDALDVGGVHFVGGVIGALLIGLFGTSAVGGVDGLFYHGGWALLGRQVMAVAAVTAYSFLVSWVIAMAIHKTIGFRISEEDEDLGMDLALHAETGYELGTAFAGSSSGSSSSDEPALHGDQHPPRGEVAAAADASAMSHA